MNKIQLMKKLNIAIIAGGNSTERNISLAGAKNIYNVLDRELYTPFIIDITINKWSVIHDDLDAEIDKNDFSTEINGNKIKFDYALINIHGTPGENGILQSYFELVSIPYSTCGVTASAITFDKIATKRALSSTNVKMAKDFVIDEHDNISSQEIIDLLGLPIFVKPNAAGSSFGISMVKSEQEIVPAIRNAQIEDSRVLIEEMITGTEISCGIMILNGEVTLFPATEIIPETDFFDYKAKYEGLSKEITPARISENVRKKLDTILINIYKTLSLRGLVRVDFIIQNEEPYLIEINTVPGMSAQSIIPQQVKYMGMTLTSLFSKIITATK